MKNIEILNYYKELLSQINLNAEVFNLVEDVAEDLESLTYIIDDTHYVNAFIIPDTSEQFEKLSLLQFTSILPVSDFIKNNQGLLYKIINNVNQSLPIGCILINSDGQLIFKYICTSIVNESLDAKLFQELIQTINNIIEFNSNLLFQNSEEDVLMILDQI